jgi:formate hydrogenlyase subunit 3/multisubunit Na+/H+ antiporter MnhD subunit
MLPLVTGGLLAIAIVLLLQFGQERFIARWRKPDGFLWYRAAGRSSLEALLLIALTAAVSSFASYAYPDVNRQVKSSHASAG